VQEGLVLSSAKSSQATTARKTCSIQHHLVVKVVVVLLP